MRTKMNNPIVALVLLSLSGCAIVTKDVTHEPFASILIGACYQLVDDSFVYESLCADIGASTQSFVYCKSIQAFGVESQRGVLPGSFEDYERSQSFWDAKLFRKNLFAERQTIHYTVQKGTKLKITRLVDFPMGESGRIWVVRATLQGGSHEGTEVELPSHAIHLRPYWVDPIWIVKSMEPPTMNPLYLKACR